MGLSLETVLPAGMLLNAIVATIFLILAIVYLYMSKKDGGATDTFDSRAASTFTTIFGVLAISTALAMRR